MLVLALVSETADAGFLTEFFFKLPASGNFIEILYKQRVLLKIVNFLCQCRIFLTDHLFIVLIINGK